MQFTLKINSEKIKRKERKYFFSAFLATFVEILNDHLWMEGLN